MPSLRDPYLLSRIFIKKLIPISRLACEAFASHSFVSEQTETRKRARHFYGHTDVESVRSNSFIEALHVLHETLATNNCFPAKACWYFLISKAHYPVEITPVTHKCVRTCASSKERRAKGRRKRRRKSARRESPLFIDYWYAFMDAIDRF